MTLRFKVGEQKVQLKGDTSLCKTQVSLRSMMRAIQSERQGILLDFGQLTFVSIEEKSRAEGPHQHPAIVAELIKEYLGIFSTPLGLPPARSHDHVIVLKEGTSPISVRPYRYPQSVKDEVERLIAEMLGAEII